MIFPYSHGRNKASQRSGTIALVLPTRLIHYPHIFKCFLLPTSLSCSASSRPVLESLVHMRTISTQPYMLSYILTDLRTKSVALIISWPI